MRSETLTPDRILAAAEREFAAVRAEMVRLARDLWPVWRGDEAVPDDDGALVRGVLDAVAFDHPDAHELLEFCRAENARIEAFCRGARPDRSRRGAARDPVDAGLPACVRRRDAELARAARQGAEGLLRDHPDARGVDRGAAPVEPSRGQRPDAPAADHPRGGPGPLPPGRLRQPLPLDRPRGLLQRPVRRGLGGLRHPGDDGRRLRRGRPGADADPLEVLPALDHQRDHRREDPYREDDRGRGGRADGRGRLPGGGRGARQVRPGAPVVHPAVDLLRRLDRDVGDRGRGPPAGRDRCRATRAAATPSRRRASSAATARRPGFSYRPHLESVLAHGSPPTSLLRRILLG